MAQDKQKAISEERNSYENETPAFNMAVMYYEELHNLRLLKSRAFINNEIIAYRDALEEIYTAICFKTGKTEDEEIQEMFHDAEISLRNGRNDSKALLRQIDMKLIKLMHKFRMIFPKQNDNGGLTKLKSKYGLKND